MQKWGWWKLSGLPEKQQRFVDEYIISLNATEAAIRAGYSERTARSQGQRLLTKVDIQRLLQEKMAALQKDTIATQDEILEHLTRVMRRQEPEYTVVTLKTKKDVWKPDENGTMRKQVVEKEEEKIVPIPTRVSDTNKAAELLGKRYAMWTDKAQNTNFTAVTIVDDIDDE